jgi:hypothetical protein
MATTSKEAAAAASAGGRSSTHGAYRDSTTLPAMNNYYCNSPSTSAPSTPQTTSTGSHSRSASSDTTASNGSAYHFILEHLLSYPGTYGSFESLTGGPGLRSALGTRSNELPLRSMYTLNSAAPPLSTNCSGANTPPSSASSPTALTFEQAASGLGSISNPFGAPTVPVNHPRSPAALFMSSIMDQIAQMPAQPASLPPAFVTSFLNRCFPIVLEQVDFPQSLTALDYLKDLESRRRKEVAFALSHHGIDPSAASSSAQLAEYYPHLSHFLINLQTKQKRADALYTQLYVALRRWILINEMALTPFNKHNCHAMLNTLYPPVEVSQPTSKLTIQMLKAQREGFFNYIRTVERQGPMCLQTLMQQGAKPGDPNGWPAVKRTLNNYLRLANSMILESQDISSLDVIPAVWNPTPEIDPPMAALPHPHALHHGSSMESGLGLEPVPESAQEQDEEELSREPAPPSATQSSTSSTETLSEIGKASPQIPQSGSATTSIHMTDPLSPLQQLQALSLQSQQQQQNFSRPRGKTDSGFSFGASTSESKHSKNHSTGSSRSNTSVSSPTRVNSNFDFGRGSTLERLARELRKMRPRKTVVDEIIDTKALGSGNSSSTPKRKENRASLMLERSKSTNSPPKRMNSQSHSQLRERSSTVYSATAGTPTSPIKTTSSVSFAATLSPSSSNASLRGREKLPMGMVAKAEGPVSPIKSRFGALRKMKSFGALSEGLYSGNGSRTSLKGVGPPQAPSAGAASGFTASEEFDIDMMSRRRLEFDRRNVF